MAGADAVAIAKVLREAEVAHRIVGVTGGTSLKLLEQEGSLLAEIGVEAMRRALGGLPPGDDDGLMDAGVREACGIFAAYSQKGVDVVPKVLKGLEALQHRGQEAGGSPSREDRHSSDWGSPSTGRTSRELEGYRGASAIGHLRYSTKGKSTIGNAQPVQVGKEFSIGHNGTIVNASALAKAISADFKDGCETDTKAAGYRLLQILKEENDWFWAFQRLAKELVGSYSFVILNKRGEVFVARDPRGYRPLCLGWHAKSRTHIAASESCALTAIEAEFVRDVEPGEMIRLGGPGRGFESFRFAPVVEPAHCSFEYTYFAHPSSRVNGVSVYEARKGWAGYSPENTER